MLILLLFVYLKHRYFVQLSNLYLTYFCLHSKLHCYFKFKLIKNPDICALIFGLTEFSFNEMLVSLKYPKKNIMKQQENRPFTTVGKSFENNCISHGYYICVHHEGKICKNLLIFLYLYSDFVTE